MNFTIWLRTTLNWQLCRNFKWQKARSQPITVYSLNFLIFIPVSIHVIIYYQIIPLQKTVFKFFFWQQTSLVMLCMFVLTPFPAIGRVLQ